MKEKNHRTFLIATIHHKTHIGWFKSVIQNRSCLNHSYRHSQINTLSKYGCDMIEQHKHKNSNSSAGKRRDTGGQSSIRVWKEFYKVLDACDVLAMVIDARDPLGTRQKWFDAHLSDKSKHKEMILIMNKSDLVPSWVARKWLHILSAETITIAFHASLRKPAGKGTLLSILRQLSSTRSRKLNVGVGFVGCPNVGKSSIINTLMAMEVCKSSPIPGTTKMWKYVRLTRKILLIDCPGIKNRKARCSRSGFMNEFGIRDDPIACAMNVLRNVKIADLINFYRLHTWSNPEGLLDDIARKHGRLLGKAKADLDYAARLILRDMNCGKIPFFSSPSGEDLKSLRDRPKNYMSHNP